MAVGQLKGPPTMQKGKYPGISLVHDMRSTPWVSRNITERIDSYSERERKENFSTCYPCLVLVVMIWKAGGAMLISGEGGMRQLIE